MKTIAPTQTKRIPKADELPSHLVVKNGQILTLDGEIPIFDLPDGTLVNVINQKGLKRIIAGAPKPRPKKASASKKPRASRKKPVKITA